MARLPDPVVDEINITWNEECQLSEKNLFSSLGNLVRVAQAKEREDRGEDKQ